MFHQEPPMPPRVERDASSKPRRPSLPPARTSAPIHRHPGLLLLFVSLLSWASLLGTTAAASVLPHARRLHTASSARLPQILEANTLIPAWKGPSLVIDTSEPPVAPPLMPPTYHGDATKTTSAPPSKRSVKTDPNASGDFQIPSPFDSALSNNFTTNCAQFFKTMLTSETVTGCHPFSLMLQVRAPCIRSMLHL